MKIKKERKVEGSGERGMKVVGKIRDMSQTEGLGCQTTPRDGWLNLFYLYVIFVLYSIYICVSYTSHIANFIGLL